MSNSEGWLEFGTCMPNLAAEREGEKRHLWKSKQLLGNINGPFRKQMTISQCGAVAEGRTKLLQRRGFMTAEFFGEVLLLGR